VVGHVGQVQHDVHAVGREVEPAVAVHLVAVVRAPSSGEAGAQALGEG
jgi:hypothetical protein